MSNLRAAANIAAKAIGDAIGNGQREKYQDIMEIGIRAAIDAGMLTLVTAECASALAQDGGANKRPIHPSGCPCKDCDWEDGVSV